MPNSHLDWLVIFIHKYTSLYCGSNYEYIQSVILKYVEHVWQKRNLKQLDVQDCNCLTICRKDLVLWCSYAAPKLVISASHWGDIVCGFCGILFLSIMRALALGFIDLCSWVMSKVHKLWGLYNCRVWQEKEELSYWFWCRIGKKKINFMRKLCFFCNL